MEHPIQGLMKTAMESIKGMVDVNTVVGEAVETQDGTVVIPVSRISLGFVAGGGEYGFAREGRRAPEAEAQGWPFGGGSGAGVSVNPVGFLVVGEKTIRFLPVDQRINLERLVDAAPELIDKVQQVWKRDGQGRAAREDAARAVAEAARKGSLDDAGDYDDI